MRSARSRKYKGASAARDYLDSLWEEEELDWTFLSPAIEMHHGTSGERKGTYRKGTDQPVFNEDSRSIISVEDTVVAVVDELEHLIHSHKRLLLLIKIFGELR